MRHAASRVRPAKLRALAALVAVVCLSAPAAAQGAAFNGRIAFASDRTEPAAGAAREFDVFSMSADGSDARRLTTNLEGDRHPTGRPAAPPSPTGSTSRARRRTSRWRG